jgi:hypothetical protein
VGHSLSPIEKDVSDALARVTVPECRDCAFLAVSLQRSPRFPLQERRKWCTIKGINMNAYFWRTHQQREIDYLEEQGGKFAAYGIKWQPSKYRTPRLFLDTYSGSTIRIIDRTDYREFVVD